jgi:beta-galactosidase
MASIQLSANGICIGGQPKILLCASLFYFRIPRENWCARMAQLRMAGYNCIDVYIPWNFHELRPGEWHFDGMHDVDAFLSLAAQHGLYVIARPGPYICSEWDGGGLPSWLHHKKLALRQDDPAYLHDLNRWLEKILPIIAARQQGGGGSVVAVQLENEMDYFRCEQPGAYMMKLRDTARACGVTVPLIACAGQCDIQGAYGYAADVYPTFNAYCDDGFTHLESQLAHMRLLAAGQDAPLMITETNRLHDTLKRELACGVKLISPYNQVGGSDIDMTNGISNWASDIRRPLALMASDYDFDSMITVDGRLRKEVGKARLMGSLISSLGAHLAAAEPCDAPVAPVSDFPTALALGQDGRDEPLYPALRMDCGWIFGATNLGQSGGTMRFDTPQGQAAVRFDPGETKLLPWRLALAPWDCGAMLLWSEAELGWLHRVEDTLQITLVGDAQARAAILDGQRCVIAQGEEWSQVAEGVRLRILPAEKAALDCPLLPALSAAIPSEIQTRSAVRVKVHPADIRAHAKPLGEGVRTMEAAGIYRGDVFYEMTLPDSAPLLLKDPADFLWAYHIDSCQARYCDGSSLCLDTQPGDWRIRVQSWGHSNFDDVRQPALKMGSSKGLAQMVRVLDRSDITNLWFIYPDAKYEAQNRPELRATDQILATTINTWSYPASPMRADFVRKVHLRADCDSFWLHVEQEGIGLTAWVDGVEAGSLRAGDHYLDLTGASKPGQGVELRLRVTRRFSHESLGNVTLLSGQKVQGVQMYGFCVEDWQMLQPEGPGDTAALPLLLPAGSERVLCDILPEGPGKPRMLVLEGTGIEATLIAHQHVCGRVLLASPGYPEVRGGSSRRIYLPGEWAQDARLHVCALGAGGKLTGLYWEEIIS